MTQDFNYNRTSNNSQLLICRQWRKSLPKLWSNSRKKPPLNGHFQSTAKQALGIVPMSNISSINRQAENFLQINERKNNKSLFLFYLE